jgi:hypothetical protein
LWGRCARPTGTGDRHRIVTVRVARSAPAGDACGRRLGRLLGHETRVAQRGPSNLTKRTAVRAQNIRAAHRQGQTHAVKSAIVALMADEEAIRRKHDLLAAAMHEYFWHTGAELTARWTKAMLGLPPSILRELAGRLQELEDVTNQTNRELKAAGLATAEGRESAEHLLNRALASMEHLTEVAEAMTRRLDELLTA